MWRPDPVPLQRARERESGIKAVKEGERERVRAGGRERETKRKIALLLSPDALR